MKFGEELQMATQKHTSQVWHASVPPLGTYPIHSADQAKLLRGVQAGLAAGKGTGEPFNLSVALADWYGGAR